MSVRDEIISVVSDVEGGIARDVDGLLELYSISADNLTEEELQYIDAEIFTCILCGWTMNRGDDESSTEDLCLDCYEDTKYEGQL